MGAAKAVNKSGLILFFLLLQSLFCFSQESFLSRKISIDIPECSLDIALREIGKAGKFSFSYDANLIAGDRQVKLKSSNTQVRTLLKEILGKEIYPREVCNHVILIRKSVAPKQEQTPPFIMLSGIIFDAANRNPLKDATVYDVENKYSAITAVNGSYQMKVPSAKKVISLTFCKSGYADTVVFIHLAGKCQLNIPLRPLQESLIRLNPRGGMLEISSIDSLFTINWLIPRMTVVNARNLEVRTSQTLHLSVIPYLSTNGKVSGSITNRFSLNLLVGYSGGLKGFEAGGLVNIVRSNISGLQIAGLGNIVGKNENGWQFSGMLNVVLKDVRQLQLSGIMNYGHNVDGCQIAGILNIARNHNDGVQIAGLLNYATIVNGFQIGLINISNTFERGFPIGLFSYVQQGYHLFEVSGNEIFYGNLAYKSGTRHFYSFVQLGMGSDYKLQASYGIGTIFRLKKNWSMNIDASAGFVYHPTDTIYHGLLCKFTPAIEYRFAKHFAIFLGPAYNFFLFSKGKPSATPRGLSTYDFYFRSTENASMQMWLGGVLGVRF